MSASPAPRPLTDAEFNALSPDQLSALGFQPAQQGAPATFSGAVYPNPTNIKPVADTDIDKGEGTRLPTGVKMTYPINRGKPQMDTSNPAQAQILPSGSTTVQAKTTGTPVPADASLLEQLAGGQPPKTDGSLLEQIATAPSTSQSTSTPSELPAGSSAWDATVHTLNRVGEGAQEGAVGALKMLDPRPQPGETLAGNISDTLRNPVSVIGNRILRGLGASAKQAPQIPAALHDINQSPDSAQLYADALAKTSGNALVQGAIGGTTEGLTDANLGSLDVDALHSALKTTGTNAINKYVPIKDLMDFTKNYEAAKAAKAPAATPPPPTPPPSIKTLIGTQQDLPLVMGENIDSLPSKVAPETAPAKPTARVKTAVTGTPAPGAPDPATANGYTRPAVLTNPQDIASAVDDIVKGKTGRQAPMKATDLENSIKSGKPVQTPFDVTEGARQTIAKDIEKTAGPAPAAKSPATTSKISGETEALRNRQTTVDGKEVNPDADFSAALKESVNRLSTKTTPEEGGPSEGYTPVSHLESDVPARGFLNKMGADEASVVKTDADHQSVQYHRQQIKNGQTPTARLDIDEEGNVIGGDGRHRAIAAIQEGGPAARMKVKVVQHSFKGVE